METLAIALLFFILGGILSLFLGRKLKKREKELLLNDQAKDEKIRLLEFENRLILKAQESVMFVLDQTGVVTIANKQAREFFKKELIGRPFEKVVHIPEVYEVISEAIEKEQVIKKDLVVRLASDAFQLGEERSLFVYVKPLIAEGEGGYTRVQVTDTTEQYRTDQVRKDFIANASHELRTPLAIINGYVETLLDEDVLSDKETSMRFLKIMKKHGHRLGRIIEEMLLISRLESGASNVLKYDAFLLKDCISECLEHLGPLIKDKNAKVKVNLKDPEVTLEADRFYWNQILFNLIENAIKQNIKDKLKIVVGAKVCKDSGDLTIWVEDDGVGIPAEDLPFIFRRFYRVEKHHSQHKVKGTGLGLSIVKRAVEAHEGTIHCDSVKNKMTKFTINLPASLLVKSEG